MRNVYKWVLLFTVMINLSACENRLGELLGGHQAPYQDYLKLDKPYKAFMVAEWLRADGYMSQTRMYDYNKDSVEELIEGLYKFCEKTMKSPEQTCRLYALGNTRIWTMYRPAAYSSLINEYKARLGQDMVAKIEGRMKAKKESEDLTSIINRQNKKKKATLTIEPENSVAPPVNTGTPLPGLEGLADELGDEGTQ